MQQPKIGHIPEFLQRLLQCRQELAELAYISIVKSCAEHGEVMWKSFLHKSKQALEKIRKQVAR